MNAPTVPSREVCCCYARTWATVIGWLQTIGNGLALLSCLILLIVSLVGLANKDKIEDGIKDTGDVDVDVGGVLGFALAISLVGIFIYVVGFVAGIVLIIGVKQENPSKLKSWIIIECIFFGFTLVRFALQIVTGGFIFLVSDVIGILVNIFFIWVVAIHRNELRSSGKARTFYENEKSLQS